MLVSCPWKCEIYSSELDPENSMVVGAGHVDGGEEFDVGEKL